MRRQQRLAVGLGMFALIYMVQAWRLPRFGLAASVVDAHIFPLVLGALLLFLSAAYFVQSGRRQDSKPLMAGVNVPLLLKLMGVTVAYALVLGQLGFVVATSLFLIGTMALLGRRQWGRTITVGIGFSVVVYLVFVYVLKVSLARGILPF